MADFKQWLEGMQDTGRTYRSLLGGVPQDLSHHPEGNALNHIKLVRASIPHAVQAMKEMQPQMPILGNISFDVTPKEIEILALASWLHDIGKASATKVAEKDGKTKVTAYGHQDPEHFEPQIEKFKDVASPQLKELYLNNKEILDFIIQHHMSFMSKTGFSKSFRAQWVDEEGKLKNEPKVKLLLLLMMADKMGRGTRPGETPDDVRQRSIGFNQSGLQTTYDKALKNIQNIATHKSEPFQGDVQSFVDMLKSKGLDDNVIKANVKKKFGVDL